MFSGRQSGSSPGVPVRGVMPGSRTQNLPCRGVCSLSPNNFHCGRKDRHLGHDDKHQVKHMWVFSFGPYSDCESTAGGTEAQRGS